MRAPSSSSKNPAKNSDEDRSRKRKVKSKSAKRRRDSSISSAEPDSRSRRKRSKSKKLEKRRRESKKSDKRRSRKKRYRRDSSSVSGESCSDSERSRSPVRRSEPRKRDRKSSRPYESSRSGRYRSPSCSTCSGGRSRSRSRSRSPVVIEERFGGRSRSRSPVVIEERFGGRSRSCSPIAIEERFGGRSCSPVPIEEERFGSSRGRSPAEERYGEVETRKVKSVIAMTKTSDEYGDKIIEAYGDYPPSRSNESLEVGNEKRNLEAEIEEKGSYDKRIRDEVISSKDGRRSIKDSDGTAEGYSMRKESEVVVEDGGNEADELELILRQKALENFRKFRGGRPVIKESLNDMKDETSKFGSYQGSQNFAKQLESKHPSSTDDQRHVQRGPNPIESKPRTVANVPTRGNDGNAVCSLSNDTGGLGLVASSINSQKAPNQSKPIPNQPKARSAANVPTEENDRNAARGLPNDTGGSKPVASSITCQKTQNPLKREQESSKKMPAEETSLAIGNQNLKGATETCSGKATSKAEVGTADTPGLGALNTDNQNSKSNEPVAESASGSQFEQKTFSRMHDGEVVQVRYKVYIPKKTPALARRQLQRSRYIMQRGPS